jgi:hypothetical protein
MMNGIKILAAGFLWLHFSFVAAAGPLEDAGAAYGKGDYVTVERLIRPLANEGVVPAQALLGVMYATGQGVPQDYVSAHMWFNLAAAHEKPLPGQISAVQARAAIETLMTTAQIAQAQTLAREWKPTTSWASKIWEFLGIN